jgi:hypothetical protein
MSNNTPLINGVNYAWTNITWVWYTLPLIGIRSITYEAKQKKELNYGQGVYPISEAVGNYEYTAEVEIFLDEWNKIIAAAPNNDPLQIPRSDMAVVYGGSRVNAKNDVLQSVCFTNDPVTVKQGDTIIAVKLTLSVAGINHK